jgi:hypothetical protein
MPELFNFFVSPHAVSQFQNRIASMDEVKARRFIQAGVLQSTNRKLLPANGEHPETLRIRTRRPFPFEFRAFCVFDEERGHFVVKTIVRGDSCVKRQHKRRHGRHQE